jgi:hypothetical protein
LALLLAVAGSASSSMAAAAILHPTAGISKVAAMATDRPRSIVTYAHLAGRGEAVVTARREGAGSRPMRRIVLIDA